MFISDIIMLVYFRLFYILILVNIHTDLCLFYIYIIYIDVYVFHRMIFLLRFFISSHEISHLYFVFSASFNIVSLFQFLRYLNYLQFVIIMILLETYLRHSYYCMQLIIISFLINCQFEVTNKRNKQSTRSTLHNTKLFSSLGTNFHSHMISSIIKQ